MLPFLVIIYGVSGVGKSTVTQEAIKILISNKISARKVVSFTTRPPRDKETEGVDYFFISKDQFLEKEKKGCFLETSFYDGNFYATPHIFPDEKEKVLFFVTDFPGALSIKREYPSSIFILITVSDKEVIKNRLLKRHHYKEDQIKNRICEAEQERVRLLADSIIYNDGPLQETAKELADTISSYLLSASPGKIEK